MDGERKKMRQIEAETDRDVETMDYGKSAAAA